MYHIISFSAQPIAQSSPQKDFLQNALQKSKTTGIDLFDEDANTESPTMSQHSNNGCREFQNIVSVRVFVVLKTWLLFEYYFSYTNYINSCIAIFICNI